MTKNLQLLEKLAIPSELSNCFLCHQPMCEQGCKHQIPIEKILEALRFENKEGARNRLPLEHVCMSCSEKECMQACVRKNVDRAVLIPDIMDYVSKLEPMQKKDVDLSVEFCNVLCENPFFLSSSVVASDYEMIAKAFDMGWAGVAFKTIGTFVPKEVSPRFATLKKESNPMIGFKNIEQISDHTLEENIACIRKLKKNFPSKVIIASIMGQTCEEWTYLAKLMEEAGADLIECNFSCPHMSQEGLGSDVGTNVELVTKYTKATREGTKLPILAKMTPNITNMEIPAIAAIKAGADGIAAINTIKSVVNVNLSTFSSEPDVEGKSSVGGYSGKAIKPIALRFIQDMKQNSELTFVPISGMGGIENWVDAAEFIALGCRTIQITTAVMQYGYRIIDHLIEGLSSYLMQHGYTKITDFEGNALNHLVSAQELNRNTICYPKFDRSNCVGCARCYLSCFDGGHQAISMEAEKRKPLLDAKKCVGCHLCITVCPTGSISPGKRVECS